MSTKKDWLQALEKVNNTVSTIRGTKSRALAPLNPALIAVSILLLAALHSGGVLAQLFAAALFVFVLLFFLAAYVYWGRKDPSYLESEEYTLEVKRLDLAVKAKDPALTEGTTIDTVAVSVEESEKKLRQLPRSGSVDEEG